MRQLTEDRNRNVKSHSGERRRIERQLKQLQAEEVRILQAYRQELITPLQLGKQLDELSSKQASLQTRRDALQPEESANPPFEATEQAVREYCNEAVEALKAFDWEKRRNFLRTLLNQIVYEGSFVKITGEIPMPGGGSGDSLTDFSPTTPGLLSNDFNSGIEAPTSRQRGRNPAQLSVFELSLPINKVMKRVSP